MSTAPPPASASSLFFSDTNAIGLAIMVVVVSALTVPRRMRACAATPLIAASVAAGAVGILAEAAGRGYRGLPIVAILAWEGSISLAIAAAVRGWREHVRVRPPGALRDLLLILCASLVFRLVALDAVPPAIHNEEIVEGLYDLHARTAASPSLFDLGYGGQPMVGWTLHSALMWILGDRLWGFRCATAVSSVAAVAATYGLAAELLGGRLAPAVAALVTSFHHVFLAYSRTGHQFVDGVLAMSAILLLALVCRRGGGFSPALLAGLVGGLLFQSYFSARAGPIAGLAWIAAGSAAWRRGRTWPAARDLAAFLLGFVVALGPFARHMAADPRALLARESKTAAFDIDALLGAGRPQAKELPNGEVFAPKVGAVAHELMAASPDDVVVSEATSFSIGRRLLTTIRIHTMGWDNDARYPAHAPFVHPLLWPLLLVGLARAVTIKRRTVLSLVTLAVGVTLGPGALLLKEQFLRRTLPIVPFIGLLCGCALSGTATSVGQRRLRTTGALLALLACAIQIDLVLRRYPKMRSANFASATGAYLARNQGAPIALFAPGVLSTQSGFIELMAPHNHARDAAAPTELGPGLVLVSALHRALVPDLARTPGVSVQWPWGRGSAWSHADSLPTIDEARRAPPALVRLTRTLSPMNGGRITLLDASGQRTEAYDSPLCAFEFTRGSRPWLRRVRIAVMVRAATASWVSAAALRQQAQTTLQLDGMNAPERTQIALGKGYHELQAEFLPQGLRDSYQLVVVFGPGASNGALVPREP